MLLDFCMHTTSSCSASRCGFLPFVTDFVLLVIRICFSRRKLNPLGRVDNRRRQFSPCRPARNKAVVRVWFVRCRL
ncbi:hypothetical protein TSPI_01089 [Trichinella spiralis]|uniref:Secreted protein n=1 Tax=Trichinella spiralis TaxID=6334 RepID=A0ABR3KU32_TRISP